MKFNKWTLGLAAIGVVSLASAAKAEEKLTALQTALSSTTISGYVDTSAQWNLRSGNASVAPVKFQGPGKADGFNLNVVQLTIAKPLDEADWASGYRADLWFGPDANTLNTQSIYASGARASQADFAIRQAYVSLRMPVGNGLDWKFGVFDTVLGYESLESGNNPNYTRSYGHTIEPQTHTGVLATYRINDIVALSAGVANTIGPAINERAHGPNAGSAGSETAESYKSYMGSIALTAPESWGWASGSTLYGGVVNGFNSGIGAEQTSWYAGLTLATPVAGLKLGACLDQVIVHDAPQDSDSVWVAGGYISYQATEKLSFHVRGEYLSGDVASGDVGLYEFTGTVQYDLWKNVISRLEFRWDHADQPGGLAPFGGRTQSGSIESDDFESSDDLLYQLIPGLGSAPTGSTSPSDENAFLIALNLIYKF